MFKTIFSHMKRRTLIRWTSFTLAIMVSLGGAAYYGYQLASQYRTSLEYTYQRALDDLGNYVNQIDLTLTKGVYAGTMNQFEGLAITLWNNSNAAKSCMAQLPVSGLSLDNTQKFLAQVGDFSLSLAKKIREGGELSEEDRKNFEELSNFAKQLSTSIADMQMAVFEGRLKIGEVAQEIQGEGEPEQEISVNSGFLEIEESFTEYPSLIYDGPFSEHIQQMKPALLEGKTEITREQAGRIAMEFTGVNSLTNASDEEGTMPSFGFATQTGNISVTKKGGYVSYYLDSRLVTESKLSGEEAVAKAREFLQAHDIKDMEESYYETQNNVYTVNFAYKVGDITCYTDLVKVAIALDTGEVHMFDARGYIMNHKARTFEKPAVTVDEAKAKLSPALTIAGIKQALIPSAGLKETLCYEFTCKGKNNEDILVYVNTKTGLEEQILILLKSEQGILAM